MATIYDWSTTAADNDDAGTPINWAENQLPATVNNSAREVMKQVADWRNLLGGQKISATADTMTLTSGMALTAYSQGQMFAFECGVTNTTGCTINVDSIGAKDIKKHKTVALVAGDLVAGGIYIIAYEATAGNFQLLSPTSVDDAAALADHIADTSTHGVSGAIVGTTDTQTLSEKTLTAPAINGVVGGTQTSATITALTATTVNGVTAATAQYTSAEETKLSGIETAADVTDATNVTAAGAVMDSELTSIADVKALDQGVATTDAPTFAGITTGGVIVSDTDSTDSLGTTGVRFLGTWTDNINGVTAATSQYTTALDTKLDAIEALADVTDSTNVLASLVGTEVVATGFTGTIDGILGGGTPAAATVTSITGASGATVTGFDTTQALGTSDTLAATQNAVKTYVDNAVSSSAVWTDVVYITNAESPYTVVANGTLVVCDSSSGAITVNLAAIGSVGDSYGTAVKKSSSDSNSITVTPSGAEEIDEIAGSITITVQNSGRTFISDTDKTPDSWTTMAFGATGGNLTVQNYTDTTDYTSGTTTQLTTSSSAASEANMVVTFDGLTQHHDTYSLSGTTVTFSSAIPIGTADVEIRWGGTLSINTPADGTVTLAKMGTNSVDSDQYVDGSIDAVHLAASSVLNAALSPDTTYSRMNLLDYGEVTNAIGSTGGGTQDINLELGNVVTATVDTSTNTFTFSNPTASDDGCSFTLLLTNGGSQTVNWPGAVDWPSATAPTLSASGLDILTFITVDGGTIWHGMVASTLSS